MGGIWLMKKSEVLMKLRQCGAVAVIRGDSYDEGYANKN